MSKIIKAIGMLVTTALLNQSMLITVLYILCGDKEARDAMQEEVQEMFSVPVEVE